MEMERVSPMGQSRIWNSRVLTHGHDGTWGDGASGLNSLGAGARLRCTGFEVRHCK